MGFTLDGRPSSQVVAHPSDIFAIAVNPAYAISAGGDSSIQVWSLHEPDHPLVHKFENAHPLGVHHLATNRDGGFAASAGFDGTINIWNLESLSLVKQIASLSYLRAVLFESHTHTASHGRRKIFRRSLGHCSVTHWKLYGCYHL